MQVEGGFRGVMDQPYGFLLQKSDSSAEGDIVDANITIANPENVVFGASIALNHIIDFGIRANSFVS